MRSRPTREGIDALRSMPKVAREQLFHIVGNAAAIIRGTAEQIKNDPKPEFSVVRAQMQIRTIDELMTQLRNMTADEGEEAYAFHLSGDGVPEAFYCEEHKPEIRDTTADEPDHPAHVDALKEE